MLPPPSNPYQALPLSSAAHQSGPFTQFNPYGHVGSGGGMLSMAGMVAGMFGAPINQMYGLQALGAGGGMNPYQGMRQWERQQVQNSVLAAHMPGQTDVYRRSFTGAAHMAGIEVGPQQSQAIDRLANMLGGATPLLVRIAPEQLDQISGLRGSQAVMAEKFFQGARFRMDPTTGQAGDWSAQNITNMQTGVYNQLFAGSSYQQRVLTAGQMGSMFEQLQRRGMVPQSVLEDLDVDVLKTAAGKLGAQGLANLGSTDQVMNQLRQNQPEILTSLRQSLRPELEQLNVNQISESLRSYEGVVGAIREIFGDAGHPNAPMAELVQALQQMTGFQAAQFDPGRLEQTLRTTTALARASGVNAAGSMMFQTAAVAAAQQMGLPATFGLQSAQTGMAMGAAFQQMGLGAHPVWGQSGIDQQRQLAMQMQANAGTSGFSNQLSTLMRIAETNPDAIKQGSRAAQMVADMRAGLPVSFVNRQDFMSMLGTDVNLPDFQLRQMLSQRETNLQYGDRFNIPELVRMRAQGEEFEQMLAGSGALTASAAVGATGAGLTPAQNRRLGGTLSARFAADLRRMRQRDLADPNRRNQSLANGLLDELRADNSPEAQALLRSLGNADAQNAWAAQQAEALYGGAVEETRLRTGQSLPDMLLQNNPEVLRQMESRRLKASLDSRFETALAPLGTGTLMQRGIQAIMDTELGGDADLLSTFMEAAGGIKNKDLARQLQPTLTEIRGRSQQIRSLQEQIQNEQDPTRRAELMQRYQDELNALRKASRQVEGYSERNNLNLDLTVSQSQVGSLLARNAEFDAGVGTLDKAEADKNYESMRSSSQGIASALINNENWVNRTGQAGLDAISSLNSAQTGLAGLAEQYAAGSISDLLNGKLVAGLSAAEQKSIAEQAAGFRQQERAALGNLSGQLGGGGNAFGWLGENAGTVRDIVGKIVNKNGEIAAGSTIQDLLSMNEADLAAALEGVDLTDAQRDSLQAARAQFKTFSASAGDVRSQLNETGQNSLVKTFERLTGDSLSEADRQRLLTDPESAKLVALLQSDPGAAGLLENLSSDAASVRQLMIDNPEMTLDRIIAGGAGITEAQQQAAKNLKRSNAQGLLDVDDAAAGGLGSGLSTMIETLRESVQGVFEGLSGETEMTVTINVGTMKVDADGGAEISGSGRGTGPMPGGLA